VIYPSPLLIENEGGGVRGGMQGLMAPRAAKKLPKGTAGRARGDPGGTK